MLITPDGGTLLVNETGGARITAFTRGPGGELTDRRVWAQLGPTPALGSLEEMLGALEYAPDGGTLDAEGHVWAADALGGRCCRIAPGGELVEELRPPEGLGVFACQLGGADGRTLLLCAAPDFMEHNRARPGGGPPHHDRRGAPRRVAVAVRRSRRAVPSGQVVTRPPEGGD